MTAEEDKELKQLLEEAKELGIDVSEYDQELSNYGSPEPEQKENIFRFFKELLKFEKTWKIGNLSAAEIGSTKLGVRHFLNLAQYAEAEGLNIVSKYLIGKANIIAEPTMGKKGFFAELFVTQIKKLEKLKEPKKEKQGWFSKNVDGGDEIG